MGNKNKGKEKTYNIKYIGEIKKGEKSYLIKLIKETNNLDENIKLKIKKDKIVLKINDIKLNLIDINNNKMNNRIIADCIIMEYDINNIESYEEIKKIWKEKFKNNKEINLIYLIGIKIDSEEEKTKRKAKNFSFLKNLNFLSLSNKNELDIKYLIDDLVKKLENERKNNYDTDSVPFSYKICFLGSLATGTKTSLINAINGLEFNPNEYPTMNASLFIKGIKLEKDKTIELNLWDTSGQERFRSLTKFYLKDADCFVLGFDVTNIESFKDIRDWYNIAKEKSNTNLMYLIGNKIDLYEKRQVNEEDARNLANELNLRYFEVSCLCGSGIEDFVQDLENEFGKY